MGQAPFPAMPVIVLAGGRSMRMGRPKALLQWPGSTRSFVTHVTDTLRNAGATRVGVVTGAHHDLIAPTLADEPVQVLYNPRHDEGQLASLLHGLRWAFAQTDDAWVMSTLVDVPGVRVDTVRAIADATGAGHVLAVRPRHGDRHGHPVVWRREVLPLLEAADPSQGARLVMRALALDGRVRDVDVDDPGVLTDVDTPAQYDDLAAGRPVRDD